MTTTPISFRPLALTDRPALQRLAAGSSSRHCGLNFINLAGWSFLFGTEVAEVGGAMVFRLHEADAVSYQAVGARGAWDAVLDRLGADAHTLGQPLRLMGLERHDVTEIKALAPGRFGFHAERDYCDYLYRREALATLAGKALQPKRNHANRFTRLYPDYRVAPLGTADIADCRDLTARWAETHEAGKGPFDPGSERRAMDYVFDHWDALAPVGATLRVDGRLVAFTYGGPTTAGPFDVCVEKADTRYVGAYAVINRDFVRSLPERFAYVNREEDLGLPGLRRAKLSYQPVELLEKVAATEL